MNGFALNIDDSFLKTLAEVDKQMSSLMKKKTKFSKGIVEAFQEISKSGVEPFVTKLKQTQDALKAISNVPIQGKASAKLKKLQSDASLCADNVNKLILAMQGLSTSADTQREWKAFDNVQRVNQLYSERIHYMRQLEEIVRKGMTSELVNTGAVTSQISTLQQKLQAIEVEIGKYNSNVKNLSSSTINALTKGEADFTLAEEKELKKRLEARRKTSETILKLENKLQNVVDKKNKLVNTAAYQSGDANAVRSYNDLIAREQDLQNKIITMRNNLGALLAEIERKYAAEGAAKEVAEIQAAEDKKLQIAKDRMAKQLAESKKYGNISSASAMRLLGFSGNVTNVAQEQAAIDKLKQARNQLNKTDANYQQTLDALNKKIAEHEHNIKMATDATYRKAQADKATLQQNTTYQGAMSYSSQTKTIQEQIQAIDYLKQARDKLDKTTMSQKDYEDSVKRLNKEIRRQQEEVDRLRDKQGALGKSHRALMDTTGQLQRKLALLFSVSAIQGYMDKLINVRKEFELQQKSLQVLLRDKDQADKLWQQTVDLAVKSPFRIKELVNYTKQLAAYRIETSKLFDTTKMLSDVSAGLGVDMQRLILAFGQVRAANFLRGTELRQFTEAGIPMLDELAKLFTELEGRVISSGEVFERISKRMVTFKDVEKVFQRMTSESGVFYNMQEEQSKTLFGMISNLHDSIDLMLNDIGRSNDGAIKDMVALTREIVDNWRAVAVVLKQVGVALGMIGISNFVSGWRLASNAIVTGSTAAVMSMNGMSGSAARLRIAMHTLGKSMKAHPWLMLIGALASAGHALWEYIEAVDAANERYDDMSRREISRADALDDLSKKVEGYNKIIKDSNTIETERNKAIQNNNAILQQIKTKYPELESLIVKQKDGTLDLNRAIKEQNDILIENIALQQRAKGGFFQESLDTNYKEAIEEYGELESAISSFRAVAMDVQSKLSQARHNELISQEDYERFSQLLEDVRKSKDFKSLSNSYQNLVSAITRGGKEVSKQVPMLGMFARAWLNVTGKASSYNESLKDLSDNLKNQKDELKVYITDAFKEAGGGKAGKEAAGEYIESFLDKFNIVDKNIREWAKKEIPELIKVDFDIIYPTRMPTPGELEPWAKRVKDAVDKLNAQIKASNKDVKDTDLFPVPEPGQMKEQYLNVAKDVLDVAKATYREGQKIEEDATVKRTKMLKPLASAYEAILNIDDKNKGKGKDWMSEVVKGLKEAHQEYIKLNKTLGASESKQMALDKYAKSFAESARNAGLKDISLGQFEFETEDGAIEALEFLKNKLPQSAKQARFKLEEAIGEIRGEVKIRTKAEDDKMLIEEIEEMFSGYEMSIELDKLNIPPDLAKQLFNVDSLTLPELKSSIFDKFAENAKVSASKLIEEFNKAEESGKFESLYAILGKDMTEKLKDSLKNIQDLEDKQQVERLKKYTKYLLKAQSERVKIKMDEIRQLKEIEDTFELKENVAKSKTLGMTDSQWDAYSKIAKANEEINEEKLKSIGLTDEQIKNVLEYNKAMEKSKQLAIEGVQKETKEKTDKQTWEDFKGTEEYIRLFEDLNSASMSSLTSMKKRLDDMRTSLDDLPPEQLKEIVRLMEKLDEQRIKVNPFKTISEGISELKASREQLKKLKEDMSEEVDIDDFEILKERASKAKDEYELQQAIYTAKKEGKVIAGQEITIGKQTVKVTNDSLKAEEEKLTELKDSNDELQKFLALYYKIIGQQDKAENKIANTFGSFSEMFSNIAGSVDSLSQSFEKLGIGGQDLQDTMASISQGLNGVANIAQGAMGLMSGNPFEIISGGIQALSGLGEVIGSFIGNGDKKKERQIQREIELVEDLERRYKKLEKAIDNAYALNTLQRSGQQAKSNINQQIAAYERMIQAEKDKKKTDDARIKEWQQAIEDLREQKAELDKEIVGTATGGILDDVLSAAQDFTNAWLDAFNETGDGLDGLSRNFKETMLEMVKQQAAMLISQSYIEKWKEQLKDYINPNDLELTTDEARRWIDSVTSSLPQLNEALERYFLAMKEAGVDLTGGNSELSGLQRGIQSVSESTAQIIEAYLNSVRFYVADSNTKLTQLVNQVVGGENTPNPILSELKTQTELVRGISTLLNSVVRGSHSMGGQGIKVFIS